MVELGNVLVVDHARLAHGKELLQSDAERFLSFIDSESHRRLLARFIDIFLDYLDPLRVPHHPELVVPRVRHQVVEQEVGTPASFGPILNHHLAVQQSLPHVLLLRLSVRESNVLHGEQLIVSSEEVDLSLPSDVHHVAGPVCLPGHVVLVVEEVDLARVVQGHRLTAGEVVVGALLVSAQVADAVDQLGGGHPHVGVIPPEGFDAGNLIGCNYN